MLRRVLLLDLNYHLNRSLHVEALATLRNAEGMLTGGAFGLLGTVRNCLEACQGADKVIGVWDGGRSARRKALFPPDETANPPTGYKANRGVTPNMTEQEKLEKQQLLDAIRSQRELATPLLENCGVHVVLWPQREADDVIFRLSRELAGVHAEQVFILSDDWDYAQAANDRVAIYRPMRNAWVSLHNFMDAVGVPIDWAVLYKAVLGDSSDNIPGVRGVGPKTLREAVQQYVASVQENFQLDWYKAHQYRTCCPSDPQVFFDWCGKHKSKRVRSIADSRELLLRNIELMDLNREEFPPEHVKMLVDNVMQQRRFNDYLVGQAFSSLGFISKLENFAHFSEQFMRIC